MAKSSYLFIAMLSLVTLVACGKKDEPGVAVVPVPAVTYVMQNGSCVQTGTTTVVAQTLCPASNTGYYSNGTQCLQTGTNIVVGPAPCPQQIGFQPGFSGQYPPGFPGQYPPGYTPGMGGNIGFQIGGNLSFHIGGAVGGDLTCRGWFYQPGMGWGICNGYNCHGMVMYNQNGPVYCP